MDWERHKYGAGVDCTFTPRETFRERAMLPGMAEHAGETARLTALWLMGEDDPYPGEWALGAADRRSEVFGRMWIASGDVTPNVLADRREPIGEASSPKGDGRAAGCASLLTENKYG